MLIQPVFAALLSSCLPFAHAPEADLSPSAAPMLGDTVTLGPTLSIETSEINIPFTLDLLRNRPPTNILPQTAFPRVGETNLGTIQIKGNHIAFKQGETTTVLSNPCPDGSVLTTIQSSMASKQTLPAAAGASPAPKRAMTGRITTGTIDLKAKR
jgi:hypothetical protein